jgi:beta-mannosidase
VKEYEKWNFRFASEFGMQSYNSPATQALFSATGDRNIFGAAMETHQKNRGGNQVILDYVSRRYRFPRDQDSLIYLSQLNQVFCIQTGVAHYRRLMPRCMGALYWQLNDCWPVASWSSIEFTGRWWALHHAARRFYGPTVVSAHVPGDEIFGINNYRKSTVRLVHLHTTHDRPVAATGVVRWDLMHLDGRNLQAGRRRVVLQPMSSSRQQTLDLAGSLAKYGRERIYLRIALDIAGRRASEDTVLFTLPRFIDFPKPRTKVSIRMQTPTRALVTFTSPVFQHMLEIDFPGKRFAASDNFFDLYPGDARQVEVEFTEPVAVSELRSSITHRSLADSY